MWRSDEGVVLRRTPFRDTSLILHLFSRQQGIVALVARGVRAQNTKRSKLDRAALSGFHTLIFGQQARSQQAMATLTEVAIHCPRHRLLHLPPALLAAQVMQEILYRFLAPHDPHPGLFALLEQSWNALEQGEDPLAWLAFAQARMLQEIGYGWRSDCCTACGTQQDLSHFSIKRSQTLCFACVQRHLPIGTHASAQDRHGVPLQQRLFPLSPELLHHLQQFTARQQPARLAPEDHALLYQMGSASLTRLRGTPLHADGAFRHGMLLATRVQ
ncbi:MAG: DNA repair protein RecO [Magnetococcales bacterium]|nr:DNA repair protein RecO [Magnetococcales bacterium]MBF0113973.1 DNA repair protein RecO [Magnetococcales bacterium]